MAERFSLPIPELQAAFGPKLALNANLSGYTTGHAGGSADALVTVHSSAELEQAALRLWEMDIPFIVLGYGSNILVSDQGLRQVVLLNRARAIEFDLEGASGSQAPSVWADSGALIGTIARQAALKGLGGFEWAAAVPGTLGGAVYGNAGAYGGDMARSLLLAEILHPTGKEHWRVEQMDYSYRSSRLKRSVQYNSVRKSVILSARIKLEYSDPQIVQSKMEEFSSHRRRTQPPGASMGSMFKNPQGDYAGRLIEACGLKGTRIGNAEISSVHANFFINHGAARASDIGRLIRLAKETVYNQTGIRLELEVELLGDWSEVFNSTGESGAGPAGAGSSAGSSEFSLRFA